MLKKMRIAALFLLLGITPTHAEQFEWSEVLTEFQQLFKQVSNLGDQLDRDYTIGKIEQIYLYTYDIEFSKFELLAHLNRSIVSEEIPDHRYLQKRVEDVEYSINKMRNRLKKLGGRFSSLSAEALQVERELRSVMTSRKNWIIDLRRQLDKSSINVVQLRILAKNGENEIEGVKKVREELQSFLEAQ